MTSKDSPQHTKQPKVSPVAQFALLMLKYGIEIDTESHVYTNPRELSYGSPITCTHSFGIEHSGSSVLLYYPLKTYLSHKDRIKITKLDNGNIMVDIQK